MPRREVHLPIDPLVPFIRHREQLAGGRQELAKRIAPHLGMTVGGAAGMLTCRFPVITLRTADKLCSALGLHVGLVWGWEEYEKREVGENPVTVAS